MHNRLRGACFYFPDRKLILTRAFVPSTGASACLSGASQSWHLSISSVSVMGEAFLSFSYSRVIQTLVIPSHGCHKRLPLTITAALTLKIPRKALPNTVCNALVILKNKCLLWWNKTNKLIKFLTVWKDQTEFSSFHMQNSDAKPCSTTSFYKVISFVFVCV